MCATAALRGQTPTDPTRTRPNSVCSTSGSAFCSSTAITVWVSRRCLLKGGVPKGSFYHHFVDKEDFAQQVIDEYMTHVHGGLADCLADESRAHLQRVRHFFELIQNNYRGEGYLGCLLGGLGQELSGTSEVFRIKIEDCFRQIAAQIAASLEEARKRGELRADVNPTAMASLLVDCWEGAALRSRLRRSPEPLASMLDFYFQSAGVISAK